MFDRMMGCDIGDRVALFVSASHTDTTYGSIKEYVRNMTDAMLLRFDPKCTTAAEMNRFHSRLIVPVSSPSCSSSSDISLSRCLNSATSFSFNDITVPPVTWHSALAYAPQCKLDHRRDRPTVSFPEISLYNDCALPRRAQRTYQTRRRVV